MSRGEEWSPVEGTQREAYAGARKRQWGNGQAITGGSGCLSPTQGLRPQTSLLQGPPGHMSGLWRLFLKPCRHVYEADHELLGVVEGEGEGRIFGLKAEFLE